MEVKQHIGVQRRPFRWTIIPLVNNYSAPAARQRVMRYLSSRTTIPGKRNANSNPLQHSIETKTQLAFSVDFRILAHRAVLRLVSDLFDEWFMVPEEVYRQEIRISKFPGSIMKKVIEFCYLGRVKIIGKDIFLLYAAAKKFQIRELEKQCIDVIKRTLDEDTCVMIWHEAVGGEDVFLEEMAADYMLKHTNIMNQYANEGVSRDELEEVLKADPGVLLRYIIKNRKALRDEENTGNGVGDIELPHRSS